MENDTKRRSASAAGEIADTRNPAFVMPEKIAYTLHRPLPVKDGEALTELSFKVPLWADFVKIYEKSDAEFKRQEQREKMTHKIAPLAILPGDVSLAYTFARLTLDGLKEEAFG